MSLQTDRAGLRKVGRGRTVRLDSLPDEFLAPVIAGAFARGVAATFDLLGIPALFFGRDGQVLFTSKAAGRHLKRHLALRAGHLLARGPGDADTLAGFVAEVLRDPGARRSVALTGLTLSALPVPGGAASDQLLHAIVTIEPAAETPR